MRPFQWLHLDKISSNPHRYCAWWSSLFPFVQGCQTAQLSCSVPMAWRKATSAPALWGALCLWEHDWWSNSDSFHKQAGPTSPGFSDSYKTAEEGTCLNALIQTQRGWKVLGSTLCWQGSHMERAACLAFYIQLLDPSAPEKSTSWTCTNKSCHTEISFESPIKSLWLRAKYINYRRTIAANYLY